MKKKFSELWHYVQFGSDDTESNLRDATYETLAQLGSKRLDKIHTILLSSEEIFGPLKDVLTTTIIQTPNLENEPGLYRYAEARSKRLIKALADSLELVDIEWKIVFGTRVQDQFIRSCHNQIIKQGNHSLTSSNIESFMEKVDFSCTEKTNIIKSLKKLKIDYRVKIVDFDFDDLTDKNNASLYFWNFLRIVFPEYASILIKSIQASGQVKFLNSNINPALNDRGLELAVQARLLFNQNEWKSFRKYLEKNHTKNS